MIVWIKGSAVEHPCNQRARVVEVTGVAENRPFICVQLLGNDQYCEIQAHHIVGVEISEDLKIDVIYNGSVGRVST